MTAEAVVVELAMGLPDDGDAGDGMPPLSFIGLGSGRSDLAERHHEILAEHLRDVS